MPSTHRLSDAAIADLARGTGDASVVAALRAGQYSKRMMQLRELLDAASTPRLDEYFELFAEAARAAPDTASAMLLEPQVGAWLAATLRRVRGVPSTGGPIGADLDHFGAIAAATAIRAGVEFKLTVGVRDGTVFLPTLGRADAGPQPSTTVSCLAGEARVGPVAVPDSHGWAPLRRLESTVDGLRLAVVVDDIDPFRDCHRLAAASRLDAAAVEAWQRLLDEAWPILVHHHRGHAEGIAAGLVSIVPLHAERSDRGMNVTSMDSFGSVSLTPPVDALGFALGLLHEFQHAKLGATIDIVPLYSRDDRRLFYAPWRDDPRPLGALLQGAYAFLGVADFWRIQRRLLDGAPAQLAEVEFVRWRERVAASLRDLASSSAFTTVGTRFLAGMRDALDGLYGEPAASDAVALAREAAEDHWVGWRLRNQSPDEAAVGRIVEAFTAGRPCPADPVAIVVRPQPRRMLAHSARLDLARLRVAEPERFQRLRAEATAADAGDLALADRDYAAAALSYVEQLAAGDAVEPWIGLALACRRGHLPGTRPLADHPELVSAVWRAAGTTTDPVTLIRWMATVPVMSAAAPGHS